MPLPGLLGLRLPLPYYLVFLIFHLKPLITLLRYEILTLYSLVVDKLFSYTYQQLLTSTWFIRIFASTKTQDHEYRHRIFEEKNSRNGNFVK